MYYIFRITINFCLDHIEERRNPEFNYKHDIFCCDNKHMIETKHMLEKTIIIQNKPPQGPQGRAFSPGQVGGGVS